MLPVTALYAGLLGLMSIAIAFQAGRLRAKTGVVIGDGGNPEMVLAMRRHGNFVEYVPLALILIGLLEMNGIPVVAVHLMGAGLVVSRASHAIGLKADTMQGTGRAIGAGGTALIVVVASVWAIVTFF